MIDTVALCLTECVRHSGMPFKYKNQSKQSTFTTVTECVAKHEGEEHAGNIWSPTEVCDNRDYIMLHFPSTNKGEKWKRSNSSSVS